MIKKMARRASLKRGGKQKQQNGKNEPYDGIDGIVGTGVRVRSLGGGSVPSSASSPERRGNASSTTPSSPGGDAATVMTASTSATAATALALASGGAGAGATATAPAISVTIPERRRRRSAESSGGGGERSPKPPPRPPPATAESEPGPRRDDDGAPSSNGTTATATLQHATSSSLTTRRAALRLRSDVREAQRLILSPRPGGGGGLGGPPRRHGSSASLNTSLNTSTSLILSPLQSPLPPPSKSNGGRGNGNNRDSAFRLAPSPLNGGNGNGDGKTTGKKRHQSSRSSPLKLRLDWSNDSGDGNNDNDNGNGNGNSNDSTVGPLDARLQSARELLLVPGPVKRSNSQSSATASLAPSHTSSRRSGGDRGGRCASAAAAARRSSPSYRLLEGVAGLAQNLVVLESTSGIGGGGGGGGGVSVLDDMAALRTMLEYLMPFLSGGDDERGAGEDWWGGGGEGGGGAFPPPTPGAGTPRVATKGRGGPSLGSETDDGDGCSTAGSSTTPRQHAGWITPRHRGRDAAPHLMAGGRDVRDEVLANAARLVDCASEEVASLTMVRGGVGSNPVAGGGPPSPPRRSGRRRFRTDRSMGTGTYRFMISVLADGARLVKLLMDGTSSPRRRGGGPSGTAIVTSCVSLAKSSPMRLSATAAAERLKVLPSTPTTPRTTALDGEKTEAAKSKSSSRRGRGGRERSTSPLAVVPRGVVPPPPLPPSTPSSSAEAAGGQQRQQLLNERLRALLEWSSNVDAFVQQQGEQVGSAVILEEGGGGGVVSDDEENKDEEDGDGDESSPSPPSSAAAAAAVVTAIQPGVFLVDPRVASTRNAEVLAAIVRARGAGAGGGSDVVGGGSEDREDSLLSGEGGHAGGGIGVDDVDEESQRHLRVSTMGGKVGSGMRARKFLARLRRRFVAPTAGKRRGPAVAAAAAAAAMTIIVGLGLLSSFVLPLGSSSFSAPHRILLAGAALLVAAAAAASLASPMLRRRAHRTATRWWLFRLKGATATSPPETSVPRLPRGCLPRPALRDGAVDALLVGGGGGGGHRHHVVIHGDGLTGKSTLAAMVANDPRVMRRYLDAASAAQPDGIRGLVGRWRGGVSGGGFGGGGGGGGGIAWVSLEREAITYAALNDIYGDVCRQLGVVVGGDGDGDGVGDRCSFGGWYAIPPEDESDSIALMEEMRARMGQILRGHNHSAMMGRGTGGEGGCLLVLDNLWLPGDVRWFLFGGGVGSDDKNGVPSKPPGGRGGGGGSCQCQLLVTTHNSNLRPVKESLGGVSLDKCRSVEVGRLSDDEALTLLLSGGGGDDGDGNRSGVLPRRAPDAAAGPDAPGVKAMGDVLRLCENLPPALRLVSRIRGDDLSWTSPMPPSGDDDADRGMSDRWEVLARHLSSSSPDAPPSSSSSSGEGVDIEGGSSAAAGAPPASPPAHHRLLERGLRCVCGDASSITELCFSAFLIVFADDPHCNGPLLRPTIPVRVANLLWEELLVQSDLVSNAHILALERMLSTFQQSGGRASSSAAAPRIFTRSGVIRNRLEAIGVIQTVSREERRGPAGYSIKYDSIHLNESCFAPSQIHDGELARNHRSWNGYLVTGYEKLVRTGLYEPKSQENWYFLRWLPLHMIRAGMLEKACAKLVDRDFIRDRFDAFGPVRGTRYHLLDAKSLLDHLRNKGQYGYETDNSMSVTVAKGNIILSFERICDVLLMQGISQPAIDYGVGDSSSPLEVGICLYTLGHALQENTWQNEAFAFYQEALHAIMSVHQPRTHEEWRSQHRFLSRISFSLGRVFESKRDHTEAVRSYGEALHFSSSSSEGEGEVVNQDVARINYRLGGVYFSDGKYVEAVQALNEALRAGQSVFGLYHEDIAQTMHRLAECEMAMKNWEEAVILLADSLQVRTAMGLGNNNADVGRTLHIMGDLQRQLGRTDEAVQSYTEALRIRRKVLGKQHIDYADSLHCLGDALQEHGSLRDALTAFTKALNIRRKVLGENHVDVATTLHNMGFVQFEMGQFDDALKSYQKALHVRKIVLGDQHRDFARTLHNIGVVHKEMGDTDRAINAFTEALWIAKELNVNAPSGDAIVGRVAALFGHNMTDLSNASSRIFGCVSLMVDRILSKEGKSNPAAVMNNHEPARVLDWIQPLLPLLKAYVNAESVIMGTDRDELRDDGACTRRRKVQFCAYDFSCVSPPVDMNIGSHAHLERSIKALDNAMNQMKSLTSTSNAPGGSNLEIAKVLLVLHAMASASEGGHLRSACAKAMEHGGIDVWPGSRFIRAAEVYKAELEAIAAHLETRSDDQSYECSLVTPLRYRLGSCIGSAMRFHLRRLFDYPPMGYTLPSDEHPYTDFSDCRACTYEVVTMCPPEKIPTGDEPKLWEGALSVVFNLALRHIHSYLSSSDTIKTVFVTKNALDSSSTTFFSITDASQRCLVRSALPLSDDDIEDVMFDIDLARVALAASRAATFLMDLLRWPGVEDAIQEFGGWGDVESIANIMVRHELANDCPDEAHFVLLKDIEGLKNLLDGEMENLSCAAQASKKFLQNLWNRFKRAGLRKRIKNENETSIRRALVDGSAMPIFPELGYPPMQ